MTERAAHLAVVDVLQGDLVGLCEIGARSVDRQATSQTEDNDAAPVDREKRTPPHGDQMGFRNQQGAVGVLIFGRIDNHRADHHAGFKRFVGTLGLLFGRDIVFGLDDDVLRPRQIHCNQRFCKRSDEFESDVELFDEMVDDGLFRSRHLDLRRCEFQCGQRGFCFVGAEHC